MTDPSLTLTGYRGMRGDVLVALKKAQPLTAKELAGQFGVTPNALRRHLKELEAEGTVRYQREIRGVGGPVFAFSLTEAGERLFPQGYDSALSAVLDLVRDKLGSEGVVEIFTKRWREVAEKVKPELDSLPLAERTQRLAQLLTSLGYMAESSGPADSTLKEHNCAIRAVIDRFPEICIAEERFLAEVLGAHVTRRSHIAAGAHCCEYCIHPTASSGTSPEETGTFVQIEGAAAPHAGTPSLQENV